MASPMASPLMPGVCTNHLSAWRGEMSRVNTYLAALPEPPRSPASGSRTPRSSPRAAKQAKQVEWATMVDQLANCAGPTLGAFIAKAMRSVDRAPFVPDTKRLYAYLDMPHKLGRWKRRDGAVQERELAPPSVHALCLSMMYDQLSASGCVVLDAGCGNGYLSVVMARALGDGGRVVGADTVDAMVESAKQCAAPSAQDLLDSEGLEFVSCDDYEDLAFRGPFDIIHLGSVLVRTGVPAKLVAMLKPGGRLIAHVGGEAQRLVVIDKGERKNATRVFNKVWPPASRKDASAKKRHRQRAKLSSPHQELRAEESFETVTSNPSAGSLGLLSPVMAPQPPQNLMFDRRVYRGSNYARPVETLADSQERSRGELAKARAEARMILEQAPRDAPPVRRYRPRVAGVQTDRTMLLTPLPPGSPSLSIDDADGAAGVYLVAHVEQLAEQLQAATSEASDDRQQLVDAQQRIHRLEQQVDEMRYAAMYAAEERSADPVVPPQPAAVAAMRQRADEEKEEDDVDEAAEAVAAAEPEPEPDEPDLRAPHQVAAEAFIDSILAEAVAALSEKGSFAPAFVVQVSAELTDQLVEQAIARALSAPEPVMGGPEPEPEPQPEPEPPAEPDNGNGLVGATAGDSSDEEESESETEDEDEFEIIDDAEDARRIEQMQKARGGRGGGAEGPSPGRRMSLADMREAGFEMQGMSKLRADLSEVEVQEYRDFFEIVDEDGNGTIDAHELKQAMTMMGMDCTDELIQAMVGEVKDSQQELEMDFEEFLVLMAIFVGPRADEQEKELRLAFDVLDDDGGGTIDMTELTEAFVKFGEKVTQAELDDVVKMVDRDGDGEIDFEEFKTVMMTAVDKDASDQERILRRKMRTTVRTLIMRQRFTSAIAAFDERYNFLRFTDAKIIAPADQSIVRLQQDQTVFEALALLRADNVPCAPVYADEARKEEPLGFLYQGDIIQLMLTTMKQMFKAAPSTDPVAIQQRMNRVAQDASTFSKTPVSEFVRKEWKPIRPGYSVFDLGFVLAKGVQEVPYTNEEGDLSYLISQESFLAAFNQDPRVRLGGVAHVTASELGCIKQVARVTEETSLIEAFKAAESTASTADPGASAAVVCDSETGKVVWFVSPETLNAPGLDTPDALGIALSKPVCDLYRDLEGQGRKEAETCKATASLIDMVRQMVESSAQRLWVVDDSERPVGMVSLTMIIECVMDAHASRKEFLA